MTDAKWREALEEELDRRVGPLPPKPEWPDPTSLRQPPDWQANWIERTDFSDGRNLDVLGYAQEWQDSDDYRKALAAYSEQERRAKQVQKERDELIAKRQLIAQKLRFHPKFFFPEKRSRDAQNRAAIQAHELEREAKRKIEEASREIWEAAQAEKRKLYAAVGL